MIDLALACAAEWDSGDRAISYWLDGSPADDARLAVFDLRISCYALVFETLQGTDDLLNEAAQGKTGYSCSSSSSRYDTLGLTCCAQMTRLTD